MALSAVSAFALPARSAGRFRPQISMLFAPVAIPSARIASFFFHRFGGDQPADSRDLEAIRKENLELKSSVLTLSQQLSELAQRNAEREKLGLVRNLCTPVAVVGADSGTRESLSLRSSTLEGITDGLFVLYPGGVVGQIEQAGVAGAGPAGNRSRFPLARQLRQVPTPRRQSDRIPQAQRPHRPDRRSRRRRHGRQRHADGGRPYRADRAQRLGDSHRARLAAEPAGTAGGKGRQNFFALDRPCSP